MSSVLPYVERADIVLLITVEITSEQSLTINRDISQLSIDKSKYSVRSDHHCTLVFSQNYLQHPVFETKFSDPSRLNAKVVGVEKFGEEENPEKAIVLTLEDGKLTSLSEGLCLLYEAENKHIPYRPHVTIAYSSKLDEDDMNKLRKEFIGTKIFFDKIKSRAFIEKKK